MPSPSYTLTGQKIALLPLRESHADALVAAASDGRLWDLKVTQVPDAQRIRQYIETALHGMHAGTIEAFVTVLVDTGQIIGSTRFWQIDPAHRKREIGHTWIARSRQGSFVNAEAKYLMLRYAFEHAHCVRVQFQTDALNTHSRNALLKLGATQEGIARNERIMPDGRLRDSVQFSIIAAEWPDVRARLQARLTALGINPQMHITQSDCDTTSGARKCA